MKLFRKTGKMFEKARKKMDKIQEEITFAEAGTSLSSTSPESSAEKEPPGKLLVIGQLTNFSKEIVEYSLDMAKRFNYDVIALNHSPIGNHIIHLDSHAIKNQQKEFTELSRKNFRQFRDAAEKKNINIVHEIKFLDEDDAIAEIQRDYKQIDFVISSPNRETLGKRKDNRLEKEIYVYSII